MKFKFFYIFTFLIYNLFGLSGCSQKEPRTIVCFGDSLTVCGGLDGKYSDYLQQQLPGNFIINKGIGGDTLAGGRKRFERDVLKLHPDIVVIELGANDYWRMKRSINELRDDLEYMVRECSDRSIKVVIAGCFGDRVKTKIKEAGESRQRAEYALEIAKMEIKIVKKYDCFYVPNMQVDIKPNTRSEFWADKNHPNKLGNKFVAKRILRELKKALLKL